MIRIFIPEIRASETTVNDSRCGDCTIFESKDITLVADNYKSAAGKRVVEYLYEQGRRSPDLLASHPHNDHIDGIDRIIADKRFSPRSLFCQDPESIDAGFSSEVAYHQRKLRSTINAAKNRDIPVVYLRNGNRISLGDISFTVYCETPKNAKKSDEYLNDGSLCLWFPSLRYLTTGDAGGECAVKHNLKPLVVKGGHHGNDLLMVVVNYLVSVGCKIYWDNDYSETLTDFLMTGRENAQKGGLTCLSVHGDINMVAFGGKLVVYKGTDHWSLPVGYLGANELKNADLAIVKSVLKGTLGKLDARTTNLIDLGYAPSAVQKQVNDIWHIIKG